MPNFSDIEKDPDFKALDAPGKLEVVKVYYEYVISKDPDFQSLDNKGKLEVKNTFLKPYEMANSPFPESLELVMKDPDFQSLDGTGRGIVLNAFFNRGHNPYFEWSLIVLVMLTLTILFIHKNKKRFNLGNIGFSTERFLKPALIFIGLLILVIALCFLFYSNKSTLDDFPSFNLFFYVLTIISVILAFPIMKILVNIANKS
ncbi:MAG: DUF898 domain-containing protein [Cyanobacteria bacterium]|nr:DUF898 domain-containing protein [Cyanobacteriota bacterium]